MFAAMAEAANCKIPSQYERSPFPYFHGVCKTHHKIRINEVIQALQENRHEAEPAAQAGQRGHDPVDVLGVAGPREPEQPHGESDAADDDLGQTPLGHRHVVVGRQLALVARLPEHDEGAGQQLARDHAEVGQAADAQVHAVDLLEDDGVGREEEVEDAVDEGLKGERELAVDAQRCLRC